MIHNIKIQQYRKLRNIEFEFSEYINALSGTNGTCKTSLLHIISNSVQAVASNSQWITDNKCLPFINAVNAITNPKVESLTRGDKEYNDPAYGVKGSLFTVDYFDRTPLNFRRHNSSSMSRYAVKPKYQPGAKDSLPYCPVIYLGLPRLMPIGEYQNDSAIIGIKKKLPSEYQNEITNLYRSFTNLNIQYSTFQQMGDVKTRAEFSSDAQGIDSNTISAGEDNLLIILTALVSLKYYFNSITSQKTVESILLIDELDATLHPAFQIKLLNLIREYSRLYKMQVFFTTHSLSLIEYALNKNDNVVYLIDNLTNVHKMPSPDIYKIKMFLHDRTSSDIYADHVIPVFTEDAEARVFLEILLRHLEKNKSEFSGIRNLFHFVDANIGAQNLINIFNDSYLLKSTMQSICILDGDQSNKADYSKYTIVLPGQVSPETLIMDYSIQLYDNDNEFWVDETIINLNYGKLYYQNNIKTDIDEIAETLQRLRDEGKSTHGVEREMRKKVFCKHKRFFELLFKHWVNNNENSEQVDKFYNDLYVMFKKVAEFHGINSKKWIIP